MRHIGILDQGVVDPVGEGDLLLIQDGGESTTLALNLLVLFVQFVQFVSRGRVELGNILVLDFLAELVQDVGVIKCHERKGGLSQNNYNDSAR